MRSDLIVCKAFFSGQKEGQRRGNSEGLSNLTRAVECFTWNHPHRSDDPHPLDVTDAPHDVTPQRHCAVSCPRSGLVPRDVLCREDIGVGGGVQVTPLLGEPMIGGGISRGQLITEAAAGVDSLITAAVLVNVRILTNVLAPCVSGD